MLRLAPLHVSWLCISVQQNHMRKGYCIRDILVIQDLFFLNTPSANYMQDILTIDHGLLIYSNILQHSASPVSLLRIRTYLYICYSAMALLPCL